MVTKFRDWIHADAVTLCNPDGAITKGMTMRGVETACVAFALLRRKLAMEAIEHHAAWSNATSFGMSRAVAQYTFSISVRRQRP